uniref:Junctophilin 3 n=1 Tax=Labrus bergylta TaxID=56723 RepID=A0A3Q3E1G1_9LABR
MRHGYGVRQSVPYGMAAVILFPLRTSINSLRSEHNGVVAGLAGSPVGRGGFALTAPSEAERQRKKEGRFRQSILSGLKLRRSESKSSLASQLSKKLVLQRGWHEHRQLGGIRHSLQCQRERAGGPVDATVTEMYAGEWRSDQRAGWGVSRRSDGLHYEGEWAGNQEGKYKQNVLVSGKRKNLIPLRAAEKASDIAKQKAEIEELFTQTHTHTNTRCRVMAHFQIFPCVFTGLECQRPKHQDAKDKDHEVISTGTDSPELCTPDTTPPVISPDLSPVLSVPTSPPHTPQKHAHRPRNACFMRQSAVDDQGGAEIQVLVEGRGVDMPRGGANNWSDDVYPDRGVRSTGMSRRRCPTTNLGTNPRPITSPRTDHGNTPCPTKSPPSTTLRWSPTHSRLTEQDDERMNDYTVDMRLQSADSQTTRGRGHESPPPKNNRLRTRGLRPVREGSMDSVQMLDNLNVGAELEEWPLHRDLTLSPPLKSPPITLEQDGENLPLKSNSGSSSILVVMVILLNIGVAILFIHFFI